MKTFLGVILVAACFVACTHSYPGASRETSEPLENDGKKNVDTVLVLPPESRPHFGRPVLDLSDPSDFNDSNEGFLSTSYFNPFRLNVVNDFMLNMQNLMKRLRERMVNIQSQIPDDNFTGLMSRIPEGANSTSTTKIINGHIVTVNETTYMDDGGVLIRIRLINVKPQNDTILLTESEADAEVTTLPNDIINDVEERTTPARSVETLEDIDNF